MAMEIVWMLPWILGVCFLSISHQQQRQHGSLLVQQQLQQQQLQLRFQKRPVLSKAICLPHHVFILAVKIQQSLIRAWTTSLLIAEECIQLEHLLILKKIRAA